MRSSLHLPRFAMLVALALATFVAVDLAFGAPAALVAFLGVNALLSPLSSAKLCDNALGTLAAATIVLQRALSFTFTRFPLLGTFAKGFKEVDGRVETMALGQTATSRILGDSAVGNFGDSASGFSMTDVAVPLSNFPQIYHKFTVDEINRAQQGFNLLDQIALPVGVKLAQAITARVFSLIGNANFDTTKNSVGPTITVAAASATRTNLILALQSACNERGIPENVAMPTINGDAAAGQDSMRYCIVNSTAYAALLADTLIVSEYNNAQNAMAIKSGRLPTVSGFDFGPYAQMPNPDGNLVGIGGSRDALAYVSRAPRTPFDLMPDLPRTALLQVVTDPSTGFQCLLILEGQVGDLSIHMRIVWLDGMAIGNPNNLIRIVSGANSGTEGQITALTVTNSGYGYRNSSGAFAAPTVTISGGGGSGATATATISANGAVTGLTITNAGSSYESVPTVTFTKPSDGSVVAPATAYATVGGLT